MILAKKARLRFPSFMAPPAGRHADATGLCDTIIGQEFEMTADGQCKTEARLCWTAKVLLATLLVLWPVELLAAGDADMSKEYLTCVDKAEGVTIKILDCMSAETQKQDTKLNDNYKKLMAEQSAGQKKSLLDAQRAWIQFRDTNCRFYYDPEGGSAARMASNECYLNMTTDRAKELKNLTPGQ
jgi:uncharacterized protein YecT (DUF1311 family)